ncbi:MAG: gliding motility-associated C-terminal domain-containing protein [Bacteroidales bacterium]
MPKVITPNGDNKNDYFAPDPAQWQGVQKHHMTVYNRWGEKVWESEDFPSGWDAKRNGNYVSDGTYFWVLEVYYGDDLIKQTLKGSLTILGVDP